MKHILIARLELLFSLTTDIAHEVDESLYTDKLAQVRSNIFGQQLQCIIGARESYLKQVQNNAGFNYDCSITDTSNKFKIMQALHKSAEDIIHYAKANPTDDKTGEILFKILEHEAQHHGQIIRYIYANSWNFPQSWNDHYTV